MKLVNKTELKLETFDKCSLLCDNDCPLGQLFDYSCALSAFILEKMNQHEEAKKMAKSEEEAKNV